MAATIGDIYQVSIIFALPSGSAQVNLGFECVTNVAGDAQANLGAAVQTAIVKATSGGLLYGPAGSVSTSRLEVEDVKPGVLATYIRTYATVAGSDGAAELTPPQCAVLVSERTALKGRSHRGRLYLPGLPEGGTNAGALTTTYKSNVETFTTNLMATFGPAGTNGDWRFGVISRYANGVKRATPIITQVTSTAVDSYVRTQRRRVIGVGS